MRARRPSLLVTSRAVAGFTLAVVAGIAAVASACGGGSRGYVPADVAYWYRHQFERGQLSPGWVLLSVGRDAERPAVLVHRVEVPSAVAGDLVMMSSSERQRLVAEIACPSAEHAIWSRLDRRHDVVVDLVTDKGPFATVSCRDAVL